MNITFLPGNVVAVILPKSEMNTGEPVCLCYPYLVLESYDTGGSPIYRKHCACGRAHSSGTIGGAE